MSIAQALANATSGLGAVSRQAAVASQNIANALTPGYNRREALLAERTLAGAGAGVRVAGIARAETEALTAERRSADAASANLGAQALAHEKISQLLGGPEDLNSYFRTVSAFDQSLRALANSPDSAAAQQAAVSAASSLAAHTASVAKSFQVLRSDADLEIAKKVEEVNASLTQLEKLNNEISSATIGGRDASALFDQRDVLLNRINESIPVRPLMRENGRIDLMTNEGVLLLSGTARTIQFSGSSIITPSMTLAGGALSGLTVDNVNITPGIGARGPGAGALAGLFAVRDIIAPQAAAELDAFALDLIERFETPGLDPSLTPGAPGLFTDGGAALAPPPQPGIAIRLSLNAIVDSTQGGAPWRLRDGLGAVVPGAIGTNKLLRDFISVLGEPRVSSIIGGRALTALEQAGELSGNANGRHSSTDFAFRASENYVEVLREAELGATGVDTDAELQSLLVIEQAYAANVRLIETVGKMIDRLMEI